MSGSWTASDPDFAGRIRRSFARQSLMATIGASLVRIEPGLVSIAVPHAPHILQQHGFVHGGITASIADTAAGYASLSLMPAGVGVLTVEFKINLVAPAEGERLVAEGRVTKPGRTLTIAQCDVFAEEAGRRKPVAVMLATMMRIGDRSGLVD